MRPKTLAAESCLVERGAGSKYKLKADASTWTLFMNGTGSPNTWTFSAPTNTWGHYAIVRGSDNHWDLYYNGTSLGHKTNDATIDNEGATLYIGINSAAGEPLNGLLDNIRISKGVARYTAAFNPPDDASAETSGKHRMFEVF
jgi:hypothetical protein